jgi:hypothetical protein
LPAIRWNEHEEDHLNILKRKSITIVMSVLLLTLSFGIAFGVTTLTDYDTHWANETIRSSIASGDVNGYPDMTFRPDQSISRAEFLALINNTFNYATPSDVTFSDVDANAWYANDVAVATHENYINGYTDGTMKPELSISRQEAAVILNNILSLTPVSTTSVFTDASLIPAWSNDSIIAIKEAGIISGYPDGSFRPTDSITRAEALVSILNSYNHTPVAEVTEPTTSDNTNPTQPTTNPSTTEAPVLNTIAPVSLGMAGDFVILAKSGISTVPTSAITGNIGVSPIDSTAITGFSLTMDATNQFGTSSQLTGKAYASDYTSPTASNLTTAVSNMEAAYVDAAGRAANYTELYAGDLSGKTLTAGVYKWSTGISANTNVTFNGSANDVWILQVADGITIASGVNIILSGGAQASNIFWQAADTVTIGTSAHFEGTILAQTNISLGTNASINGRLYAQTAVTLDANIVVKK